MHVPFLRGSGFSSQNVIFFSLLDRVFNSLETTSQVYQEVAVPIIRSVLHGYNGNSIVTFYVV